MLGDDVLMLDDDDNMLDDDFFWTDDDIITLNMTFSYSMITST